MLNHIYKTQMPITLFVIIDVFSIYLMLDISYIASFYFNKNNFKIFKKILDTLHIKLYTDYG